MRKRTPTIESLQRQLTRLASDLAALATPAEPAPKPEPQVRAKGSVRVPVIEAAPEPQPETEEPLAKRLEELLRERPRTLADLEGETEDERTRKCFLALRRAGKVANVGSDAAPVWTWVIGDEVDTPTLRSTVERYCRLRPFTHSELVHVTGANPNRVKGVITDLKLRRGTNARDALRDFGTLGRGVYFYPPVGGTPMGKGAKRKRRKTSR